MDYRQEASHDRDRRACSGAHDGRPDLGSDGLRRGPGTLPGDPPPLPRGEAEALSARGGRRVCDGLPTADDARGRSAHHDDRPDHARCHDEHGERGTTNDDDRPGIAGRHDDHGDLVTDHDDNGGLAGRHNDHGHLAHHDDRPDARRALPVLPDSTLRGRWGDVYRVRRGNGGRGHVLHGAEASLLPAGRAARLLTGDRGGVGGLLPAFLPGDIWWPAALGAWLLCGVLTAQGATREILVTVVPEVEACQCDEHGTAIAETVPTSQADAILEVGHMRPLLRWAHRDRLADAMLYVDGLRAPEDPRGPEIDALYQELLQTYVLAIEGETQEEADAVAQATTAALREDPAIRTAEVAPDATTTGWTVVGGKQVPTDPLFHSAGSFPGSATPEQGGDQWSIKMTAPWAAWNANLRGQGMRLAVMDTGVDGGHPDFQNAWEPTAEGILPNGVNEDGDGLVDNVGYSYDWVTGPPRWDCPYFDFPQPAWRFPCDPPGHGTHVAGISTFHCCRSTTGSKTPTTTSMSPTWCNRAPSSSSSTAGWAGRISTAAKGPVHRPSSCSGVTAAGARDRRSTRRSCRSWRSWC